MLQTERAAVNKEKKEATRAFINALHTYAHSKKQANHEEFGAPNFRMYQYGQNKFKVTLFHHNTGVIKNIEDYDKEEFSFSSDTRTEDEKEYERLGNNVARAKEKVREYGYCNDWEYFFTGTVDPKKYDREKLPELFNDFSLLIKRLNEKGANIKYLIIPELHEDGESWHFHGFLSGNLDLTEYRLGTKGEMTWKMVKMINNGHRLYKWEAYANMFGYCCLEPVKNKDKAVSYICKYINKNMLGTGKKIEKGMHLFRASKGLLHRIEITGNKKQELGKIIESMPNRLYVIKLNLGMDINLAWVDLTDAEIRTAILLAEAAKKKQDEIDRKQAEMMKFRRLKQDFYRQQREQREQRESEEIDRIFREHKLKLNQGEQLSLWIEFVKPLEVSKEPSKPGGTDEFWGPIEAMWERETA